MSKTTLPSIVLTRPEMAAKRFAAELRKARPAAQIVISPVIRIAYLEVCLPKAEALVFTSRHRVEGYFRAGGEPLEAYCVGEQTAQAARKMGCAIGAIGKNAAELSEVLPKLGGKVLLHPRGTFVTGGLAQAVPDLVEAVVYDQPAEPLSAEARRALEGESPVVLPLFSPRSAREIVRQVRPSAPIHAVFMSKAVEKEFSDIDRVASKVSDRPDGAAMLEATLELFDAASSA